MGYVYRTFDIFGEQRQRGIHLEKMRGVEARNRLHILWA